MAGDLVLITGATGYVGFAVLRHALKAGFRLRAAVRSESKGKKLQESPVIKGLTKDSNFEFVVVPDFEVPGALNEAAKGARFVLHVASPIPAPTLKLAPEQVEDYFVGAAVKGTNAALEAAQKAGTVERVVITSSCAALLSFSAIFDYANYDGRTVSADDHPPKIPGPIENPHIAYFASKAAAREAAEDYVKKNSPGFDVVQIHPSVVTGPGDQFETIDDWKASTNGQAFESVLGSHAPMPFPQSQVHIDDVAKLHVLSLDKAIPAGSYIADSDAGIGRPWEEAKETVKKYFPKAVESGVLPLNGTQPSTVMPLDIKKSEEVFGIEFQSFEEQTKDAIKQYLQLAGHAAE